MRSSCLLTHGEQWVQVELINSLQRCLFIVSLSKKVDQVFLVLPVFLPLWPCSHANECYWIDEGPDFCLEWAAWILRHFLILLSHVGGCGRFLQHSICCLLWWCFIKDEQNCLSRSQDAQIEKEKQVYNVTGGCTALTVVYLLGKLYVANAGDSRCVRLSSVPSMKGSVKQWN